MANRKRGQIYFWHSLGDSTGAIGIRQELYREISERLGRRIELRGPGRPRKDKNKSVPFFPAPVRSESPKQIKAVSAMHSKMI